MNINKRRISFIFATFKYSSLAAMITRNGGHAIVGLIIRLVPTMGGNMTAGVVRGIKYTLSHLSYIAQTQGLTGLVKRLKAASVTTQQAIGGYKTPMPLIARTASGYPKFLPANWRRLIRSGNTFYMRMTLTIMSLYRDIMIPGTLKLSSITDPFKGNLAESLKLIKLIPRFVTLFCGTAAGRAALSGRFSYFPITKASPQSKGVISTDPLSLIRSAKALLPEQIQMLEILYKLSCINRSGRMVNDPVSRINLARSIPATVKFLNPFNGFTGKIGIKQEAAGKVRAFAMVDPWTQLAMAPIHKALFRILSKHPSIDGTFNQLGPIERAWAMKSRRNHLPMYSMDLSSATDRLPIFLQTALIKSIFCLTDIEASAWQDLLIKRPYVLPKAAQTDVLKSVTYAVGQPMGALSSWAMLAFTHHFIVQCAAWYSGHDKGTLFRDYCVLGDDIVIYNHKVAKTYHHLITVTLGVECQLSKSILSPKGLGLEFAKKTFYLGNNVSPSPLKEFFAALASVTAFAGYSNKYHLSPTAAAKVAGFGWRVQSSMNKPWRKLNFKLRYLILTMAFTEASFFSTIKQLRPHLSESDILSAYLGLVYTIAGKVYAKIQSLLEECSSLDVNNPGNRVTTIFVQYLKKVKGKGFKLSIKAVPLPNTTDFTAISHIQLKWALEVQSSVKRILKPLGDQVTEIMAEIDYLRRRKASLIWGGPSPEVESACPVIFANLMKLVHIQAKAVSRSIDSLWARSIAERRPGAPKAFRMAQAYSIIADEVKKAAKADFIPSDVPSSGITRMSGFVPPLRLLAVPLRRFFSTKVVLRVLIRRSIWTGSFFTLLSLLSLIKGVGPVIAAVLAVWTTLQTLFWIDQSQGSWLTNMFYSIVGNVILHSFELYLSAMILVVVSHFSLYEALWLIDYQAYLDGSLTILGFAYDLLIFTNSLMLDVASNHTTDVKDFIAERISAGNNLENFLSGYFIATFLLYFVRWFLGF